jgi:hypothetical protein
MTRTYAAFLGSIVFLMGGLTGLTFNEAWFARPDERGVALSWISLGEFVAIAALILWQLVRALPRTTPTSRSSP